MLSGKKSKIEILRKLDSRVRNIPTVLSLVLGIVGMLIFGFGLTMIIEWNIIVWGVVVGALGFIVLLFAYPVFLLSGSFLKNKYSKEILRLSEELLSEEK